MLDFKLPIVYSTSHTVMPKIIFGVLVILGIILFIQYVMKTRKEGGKLFSLKGKRFFEENYDRMKLFGTVIILFGFIVFMKPLGFILAGIIFMSLFNILYDGKFGKKDLLLSISISVVETMTVWFIFGYLFDITLP